MFNSRRAGGRTKILLSALSLHLAGAAYGATVGQLSSNTSIWANSGNFSTIYTSATVGAGHTVESGEALTAQNIANNTHFIVESSTTALAAAQVSLLVDYVRGGGTLLLFATPGTGVTSANQILSALGTGASGSTMSATTMTFGFPNSNVSWGELAGTNAAVVGGPYNLSGQSLSYNQSNILTGGTLLASNNPYTLSDAVRTDRYNLGNVYLFGTHMDRDGSTNANQNNVYFFMNILGSGGVPIGLVDTSAPEPATFALTAFSLAGAILFARRRRG